MGVDVLRCKSPAMVHKEMEMHWIGYNLIRALMGQTARQHGVALDRISFHGTLDAVNNYAPQIAAARTKKRCRELLEDLRSFLAHDLAPERPGRREPRAVKRRPKPYAMLNKPRHQYKDTPHRQCLS